MYTKACMFGQIKGFVRAILIIHEFWVYTPLECDLHGKMGLCCIVILCMSLSAGAKKTEICPSKHFLM